MNFKLVSQFAPTGDQPQAISQLVEAIKSGTPHSTLLGVTGSGKTFTMANVIAQLNRPTLILSHNKTLAAQLYGEFKAFFPENVVEYFVSYYDYYQPEAYLPTTDTYIEKDLSINEDIEKMRLSTTSALLSGRRDVIVISSVSCLYGIGNPEDFHENTLELHREQVIDRNRILYSLVDAMYSRNEMDFKRGTFRVKGDTIDIFPAYGDIAYRVVMFDREIEELCSFDPVSGQRIERLDNITIYPATIFVSTKERMHRAIKLIQYDLTRECEAFIQEGRTAEAKKLKQRVEYDLEMIKELGYCSGIENYSRYFDGRDAGSRPFCLIDYFQKDFLTIIDESHVTIPQIHGMYGGDYSRKRNLVEYGFRLSAAIDNRPLKFSEFESLVGQCVYVSATPADYELVKSEGIVVEQLIRPTGLLDPEIEVRPTDGQIDNLLDEIELCTGRHEKVMVTTLTKRMAEELNSYFERLGIRCRYIHSDVDTLERIQILDDMHADVFDVLIGVNLLREGLDMPEVALVAIMDADKEGFLRSTRSLTQTAGRAARNANGRVIMYADRITDSMRATIAETNRRRSIQIEYNKRHSITPRSTTRSAQLTLGRTAQNTEYQPYPLAGYNGLMAADTNKPYITASELEQMIEQRRIAMEDAAKKLDFIAAAQFRDQMYDLQAKLKDFKK
jgi:excinuclease ABC subunit B